MLPASMESQVNAHILDETTAGEDSDRPKFGDKLPAPSPPIDHQAAFAESRALLDRAMTTLPPRLRTVAEGIQSGKNNRLASSRKRQ